MGLLLNHSKKHQLTLLGGFAGFVLWTLLSHPKSHVNKKMPETKFKNLRISPQEGAYVKYLHKNKTFHLHHWLLFSTLYVPVLAIRKGILKSKLLHGFFLGSILQGLIYEDRFKVIETLEHLIEDDKSINFASVK